MNNNPFGRSHQVYSLESFSIKIEQNVFQLCLLLNSLGGNHCISRTWSLFLPSTHHHQPVWYHRGLNISNQCQHILRGTYLKKNKHYILPPSGNDQLTSPPSWKQATVKNYDPWAWVPELHGASGDPPHRVKGQRLFWGMEIGIKFHRDLSRFGVSHSSGTIRHTRGCKIFRGKHSAAELSSGHQPASQVKGSDHSRPPGGQHWASSGMCALGWFSHKVLVPLFLFRGSQHWHILLGKL